MPLITIIGNFQHRKNNSCEKSSIKCGSNMVCKQALCFLRDNYDFSLWEKKITFIYFFFLFQHKHSLNPYSGIFRKLIFHIFTWRFPCIFRITGWSSCYWEKDTFRLYLDFFRSLSYDVDIFSYFIWIQQQNKYLKSRNYFNIFSDECFLHY